MPKRTWKVRISLEEKGEPGSWSNDNLGTTELAIPGDFPTEKVGEIVAAHADAILATARETRPESILSAYEITSGT